ncbi:metalloendopeptidase PepO [Melioribacter roseus P3M-2]|uniref:Metalloendopeptidase PepO n=1 Tax=Melioribacter roseus (strain DSM 23840 / JCM 17771 / VKM B-2668 / P3M-2) TaxID=1191523 RepID=I7A2J7_MELRP|nr:M13 family metallopeptidase [Melioribacter roseus]AFN74156.1 metalloendopeptidase PepO [Melioribacter roseus P3M-2]
MRFKIILFGLFILSGFILNVYAEGGEKGFDINNLNKSVSPKENFYEFAVGNWVKNNPVPPDQSRWGMFNVLIEKNNELLRSIVEEVASNPNWEKGTAKQKIADFYVTAMDSARIERYGYKPILPMFNQIDKIRNKKELIETVAEFHKTGISPFFIFYVASDAKRSDLMAAHIYQGGVGLPDVEYYTKDDDRSKEIRDKYVRHVAKMFALAGEEQNAGEYANKVMKIETALAKVSNTRLENRDPIKTYNKMTLNALKKTAPEFDWDRYFEGLGVENLNIIVIRQPEFIKGMSALVDEVSLDDWKVYLKWNVINETAEALSAPFVMEKFEFEGKFLRGQQEIQPRWKRVINVMNRTLGQLLGQVYVEKAFPPESKAKAKAIVDNLLVSMKERIQNLEWMSDETKASALKKLSTFGVKIGYPDKWKDYSELEIKRDSYLNNLLRAWEWDIKDDLKKIGQPADKSEWSMNPQTVNAMYSPTRNDITFPAGILQPPFFNPEADDAINYGAMGAVIGHEITHGFDDQGRKYDENGNLNDWWTEEDNEKFQQRAQKLVDLYNGFVVIDTFKVNGALTLGENIADLGGLTVSFNAFKKTEQFKKGEKIDGFTPAQRFFLGWAQVWATNIRPEALKLQVKTDVHSPAVQRVNGPLMTMPEFFEAYDVQPGDPMRISDDKIVKIW